VRLLLVSIAIAFVCTCMSVVYNYIFGFCVGLIDFAMNFCCPYQCKWLPWEPCNVSSQMLNLTYSLT